MQCITIPISGRNLREGGVRSEIKNLDFNHSEGKAYENGGAENFTLDYLKSSVTGPAINLMGINNFPSKPSLPHQLQRYVPEFSEQIR